ncbi:hypothetical protein CAAN1_14S03444 [[Candida] anglica]|uniref:Uncharacterized protein n=1 Tax=[Candida] anglica TaxID=148631 RepID=A0ABP0EKM7_9ASCO
MSAASTIKSYGIENLQDKATLSSFGYNATPENASTKNFATTCTTTTYRVGNGYEICIKRESNENSPFDTFKVYISGFASVKLVIKSPELNYNHEFALDSKKMNMKLISWTTEKVKEINLLKITIPHRKELPRSEVMRRRREKRNEKKRRVQLGLKRRLPAGSEEPMSINDAFDECIQLFYLRMLQELI